MRFNSEANRMQHLQAKLIPQPVWLALFHEKLSKVHRSLMDMDADSLVDYLSEIELEDIEEAQVAWLVIAYSHGSTVGHDFLISIAQTLKLSTELLFISAAIYGNSALFKQLINTHQSDLQTLIATHCFSPLRWAAAIGHIEIVTIILKTCAPDKVQTMIEAPKDDPHEELAYDSFRCAAENGHEAILIQLMDACEPDQVQEMIEANDWSAFRDAARNGHLNAVKFLVEKCAKDQVQKMLESEFHEAFYAADLNKHGAVTHYLLSFPTCFDHAEKNPKIYHEGKFNPFVKDKLENLHERATQSLGRFDVPNEEAQLCFYLLRNLIRRHSNLLYTLNSDDESQLLLSEIRFLLNLQSVKALVHEQSNMLLRFAAHLGNEVVAGLLIKVNLVRSFSQDNSYYEKQDYQYMPLQSTPGSGKPLDLRQLAEKHSPLTSRPSISPGFYAASQTSAERDDPLNPTQPTTALTNY